MYDLIINVFGGLQFLFQAVLFVLVVSAVLSWLIFFNVINTRNPAVWQLIRLLERITGPILAPFRMFIPPMGGIDLSFLVAFLLIQYGILGFLLPTARENMLRLAGY
jgi:YggT family protein